VKQNDISALKDSLEASLRNLNVLSESQKAKPHSIAHSVPRNFTEFSLPSFNHFLPHFKGDLSELEPKFVLSKNRYADLVIGIPTIKRDKTSYLIETLKSLFDSIDDATKARILVIVFIAEVSLR